MLNDFTGADQVYIACGYIDLRYGVDVNVNIILYKKWGADKKLDSVRAPEGADECTQKSK